MITKERLEELIENQAIIYLNGWFGVIRLPLNKTYEISGSFMFGNGYNYSLKALFETKAEADWVAKMHTSRTEYFEPPFKLEPYEEYVFHTKKWGRCAIKNNDCDEKTPYNICNSDYWLYVEFKTYEEAVEYARKLFKGETDAI